MLRADGHPVSCSSVQRGLRRRGLLQPVDYAGARWELAQARRAAFAPPPTGPNQVWQLDFSEYETTSGGIWRLAGCCDYFSQIVRLGTWRPGAPAPMRSPAVQLAIGEAERLAGGVSLLEQVTDQTTGQVRPIKLVTDNGGAFKARAFAAFLAARPELVHIRTRCKSPGQNGVRERAFGSLKYVHLYRLEIADLPSLAREGEAYRQIFNHIPHEALGLNRPIEIHQNPTR